MSHAFSNIRMLSLTFACVRIVMMFFNSQKNLFRGLKFSLLQKRTLINFDNKNKTLKMNEAYFKHLSDEGKIAISFRFVQQLEEKKIDRVFNFVRDLSEEINVSLNRIRNNLEKEFIKKSKKKAKKNQDTAGGEQKSDAIEIKVNLRDSHGTSLTDKTFNEILGKFESSQFYLDLYQSEFKVRWNCPWINTITLPASILAGFYIYPAKLEIDFADRHSSEFIWYRGKGEEPEWEEVARGFSFLIRLEDIGYKMKLSATPKSPDGSKEGPTVEVITKSEVQAGPGHCPFETRHLFTPNRLSGNQLRIASYNLLADYYADSDDGRTKLFCYCPEYALKIDYRKQLLLKEIIGYNADIFCMQEVDFKIFDGDLIPFLGEQSMNGVHNKKGTTPEGVSTFYRTDRFELMEHHGIAIGDAIKNHPSCQLLYKKIESNQKLVDRICDLGTTVQVIILKSKEFPDKYFTIANTHLYFHPDADHIRLLQFGFSMILIQEIMETFKEKTGGEDMTFLFCGDFNSTSDCGIYKLMTDNYVPSEMIDWKSNSEQAVSGIELAQPILMQSACGIPAFTNYTVGFKECIDYIFYQTDKLKVTKVVETPEEDDLKTHIAIPSVVFPSDHIALVTELEILN